MSAASALIEEDDCQRHGMERRLYVSVLKNSCDSKNNFKNSNIGTEHYLIPDIILEAPFYKMLKINVNTQNNINCLSLNTCMCPELCLIQSMYFIILSFM